MDVLFLSASNDDLPTREAIVQALGSDATLISTNVVHALSGGLGRSDIVILPLRTFSADDQTSIGILRRQLACPVLCVFCGDVPEEFRQAIAPAIIVDARQTDWKQVILDQMPRRQALSAV